MVKAEAKTAEFELRIVVGSRSGGWQDFIIVIVVILTLCVAFILAFFNRLKNGVFFLCSRRVFLNRQNIAELHFLEMLSKIFLCECRNRLWSDPVVGAQSLSTDHSILLRSRVLISHSLTRCDFIFIGQLWVV